MSIQHPAASILRDYLTPKDVNKAVKAKLDAVEDDESFGYGASDYADSDVAIRSINAVQEWLETDDLDDGETLSDRLVALMIGVADEDKNGEITEDEQGVLDMALNDAWDYMLTKGVTDEDADCLLNDWDEACAQRVRDVMVAAMPDGEDASSEDADAFVFGEGSDEPALDAVYKMKMAVRGGKKIRIRKRVSGTVRLSAKQKASIRKASRKAHSAAATMRRARSNRLRAKYGLNK